jgi:hypothetical protein
MTAVERLELELAVVTATIGQGALALALLAEVAVELRHEIADARHAALADRLERAGDAG